MKKVEDRVVEEVSNAIVRAAYKPIDKAFDNMVKEYYADDTLENGEIDWDKVNRRYEGMMASFDASDRLPASYSFDVIMDVENTDYQGEENKSKMYYAEGKELFAIAQAEGDVENLVVIDIENDLIAIFSNDDGKKTVTAVPNMLKMAGAYSNSEAYEESFEELSLEKTGKTKNIAGYHTEQYKGENETEYIESYVAPEFPVDWRDTYGGFIRQYTPESYAAAVNKIEGMVLMSINTLKEDKKKKSVWEVTKVDEKEYQMDISEYEKQSYANAR